MARKTFSAAPGSPFSHKDAKIIGSVLDDLDARNGGKLTARVVLDSARSSRSPIYRYFEWDDEIAGERFRLVQARQMIAHVRVRVVDQRGQARPEKAWFSVKDGETPGRVYASIERVATEVELRDQVIGRALEALQSWAERYKRYKELGGIRVAIHRFIKRTQKKRRRSPVAKRKKGFKRKVRV